jgi:hypothetical protein
MNWNILLESCQIEILELSPVKRVFESVIAVVFSKCFSLGKVSK